MRFQRVMRISRPRFWIYELGPFMIGILSAMYALSLSLGTLEFLRIIVFGLYFLIPANIWIYGINDIYDYETDKLNPKKQGYEALVEPKEHKKLRARIIGTTIPFLFALPFEVTIYASFLLFLFFSAQYSATPIRAKGRPILDSLFSAGHYIATAAFGFFLVAPSASLNYYYIAAGVLWAVAMHAYSAVPDIKADTDAGVPTIATFIGARGTLILCLLLYIIAGLLSFSFGGRVILAISVVYGLMMILSLAYYKTDKLFVFYKRFPRINALSGMALFFMVLRKIL